MVLIYNKDIYKNEEYDILLYNKFYNSIGHLTKNTTSPDIYPFLLNEDNKYYPIFINEACYFLSTRLRPYKISFHIPDKMEYQHILFEELLYIIYENNSLNKIIVNDFLFEYSEYVDFNFSKRKKLIKDINISFI